MQHALAVDITDAQLELIIAILEKLSMNAMNVAIFGMSKHDKASK